MKQQKAYVVTGNTKVSENEFCAGRDEQSSDIHRRDNRILRGHIFSYYMAESRTIQDCDSAHVFLPNNQRLEQPKCLRMMNRVRNVDIGGKNLVIHIKKRTAKQGLKTITLWRDIGLTAHAGGRMRTEKGAHAALCACVSPYG